MKLPEDFGNTYINIVIPEGANTIFPVTREERVRVVKDLLLAQATLEALGFNPSITLLSKAYKGLSESILSLLEAGMPVGECMTNEQGSFGKYYSFNNSVIALFGAASMFAVYKVAINGRDPGIIPIVRAAETDRQTKFIPPSMIMAFARSFADSAN